MRGIAWTQRLRQGNQSGPVIAAVKGAKPGGVQRKEITAMDLEFIERPAAVPGFLADIGGQRVFPEEGGHGERADFDADDRVTVTGMDGYTLRVEQDASNAIGNNDDQF